MLTSFPFVLAVFLSSLLLCAVNCGLIVRLARRYGFTDKSDEKHKQHGAAVPLGGGLGIFVAVFVVWAGASRMMADNRLADFHLTERSAALVIAAALIVLLGIIDDRFGMRGIHKLLGQAVAAGVLVAGGYCFRAFGFCGIRIDVGSFGFLLSILWMLGAINAINLLDGADGVASTLGIGICVSLGFGALLQNGPEAAIIPFALAGALVGFLFWNFPPAKMYLGDSGSMLVGLVAAATAIESSVKSQATFAIAAPLALLSIPIIDTLLAIFRRKLMGRSIYDTDRGHLHHHLLGGGRSPRQVVAAVAVLTFVTSAGAILSISVQVDLLSIAAVVAVIGILLRWKIAGQGEMKLILSRLKEQFSGENTSDHRSFVHIQGTRDWSRVWRGAERFAVTDGILAVNLSVSMPWLQEAFCGRVGASAQLMNRSSIRLSVPLKVHEQRAGWIDIAVHPPLENSTKLVEDFVRELQAELSRSAVPESESVPIPIPHITADVSLTGVATLSGQ